MAVTPTTAGKFTLHVLRGEIAFQTDTFKATLHTSSFAPNKDTLEFYSAVTNELATAGGYTAGGVTLSVSAPAYDSANDRTGAACADAVWNPLTATFRYLVVRKDTGSAATSPIVGWIDFGADQSPNGVAFTADMSDLVRLLAA